MSDDFKVEAEDACVVFKANGELKLLLPETLEGETVKFGTPEGNVYLVSALFSDDERAEELRDLLWEIVGDDLDEDKPFN